MFKLTTASFSTDDNRFLTFKMISEDFTSQEHLLNAALEIFPGTTVTILSSETREIAEDSVAHQCERIEKFMDQDIPESRLNAVKSEFTIERPIKVGWIYEI